MDWRSVRGKIGRPKSSASCAWSSQQRDARHGRRKPGAPALLRACFGCSQSSICAPELRDARIIALPLRARRRAHHAVRGDPREAHEGQARPSLLVAGRVERGLPPRLPAVRQVPDGPRPRAQEPHGGAVRPPRGLCERRAPRVAERAAVQLPDELRLLQGHAREGARVRAGARRARARAGEGRAGAHAAARLARALRAAAARPADEPVRRAAARARVGSARVRGGGALADGPRHGGAQARVRRVPLGRRLRARRRPRAAERHRVQLVEVRRRAILAQFCAIRSPPSITSTARTSASTPR